MIDASEALRKAALRLAASRFAPGGRPYRGGIGAVLALNGVAGLLEGRASAERVAPELLDRLVAAMKAAGYQFVSMDEAATRLAMSAGSSRFAAVGIDIAYRDTIAEALPVFETHIVPFTVYVAPALVDGTIDPWWDVIAEAVRMRDLIYLSMPGGRVTLDCSTPRQKRASLRKLTEYLTLDIAEADRQRAVREIAAGAGVDLAHLRRNLLLGWEEIRALATHPLATIGALTVSHLNLARLSDEDARRQIREARRIIESEIGLRPAHLAYPYGGASSFGARDVALAREAGYATAVTANQGVLRRSAATGLHALPRISLEGGVRRIEYVRAMLASR